MQYLITLPDNSQAIALIDYIKSSGIALKVKAVKKNKEELSGANAKTEPYEVPARTDEELREMLSYHNSARLGEILKDDDCSNLF